MWGSGLGDSDVIYIMITWQFNFFFLQQVMKNHMTFSDDESIAHFDLVDFYKPA
jgi:hypothetical protein